MKGDSYSKKSGLIGLDEIVIVPNYLYGNKPLDPILHRIDCSLKIGPVDGAQDYPSSIMLNGFDCITDTNTLKGFIYGASLQNIPIALDPKTIDNDLMSFMEEIGTKFIVRWTPSRKGIDTPLLRKAAGIELVIGQPSLNNVICATDVEPSLHLDIESPKDIRKHINLLREVTGGMVPVWVKMGAGNVYGDVKYCIKAGSDAAIVGPVNLSGGGDEDLISDIGVPIIGIFRSALKAIKETNARPEDFSLVVSGNFTQASEIFKVLAMGCQGVALNPTAVTKLIGKKSDNWKTLGGDISNELDKLASDLRYFFAITSTASKADLSPESLRAKTYNCASITGLKLIGYEKQLPMWMH